MPIFFLDVRRNGSSASEPDGQRLTGTEAARVEAMLEARHLVFEALKVGYSERDAMNGAIDVKDVFHRLLFTVTFEEGAQFGRKV